MSQALTQAELFALLNNGHGLVLPHAHAARTLRARYAAAALVQPPAHDPGRALAWAEWTASLWIPLTLAGAEERVLLNRAQEDHLWAEIIAGHPANPALPPQPSQPQTQLTRSGLRLAAAHSATDRLRSAADSFDTRTFAGWAEAFRDLCSRQRLLSLSFLEAALVRHLRDGTLQPPLTLFFAGFEEFTPAQRDLLTALRAAGTTIHEYDLSAPAKQEAGLALVLPDTREQLRFAVRWIADQAGHATQTSPTFALITPRADEHRPALERLLREFLAPELNCVAADLSSTPWQFTGSTPLGSATLAAHALVLLRWTLEPLPLERIGQLLLSPYFNFSEPVELRARFEANTLRNARLLRPELDLPEFLDLITNAPRKTHRARFPELHALARLGDQRSLRTATRPHADWADTARSLLATLGWPGPRTLTASEFSAVETWDGVLDLLSTLDVSARRLPFTRFIQQLETEVGQAGSGSPPFAAPVQILTLAQAEGIAFDHVLVLDATDRDLPAPETAHPLLTRRLQVSLGMPGVDPAKSYARTRSRLQRLIARAGRVHLLAPAEDLAGPLHLSRLTQDLDFRATDPVNVLTPKPFLEPQVLTPFEDIGKLPPLPSPAVQGGARVLELQAACGFRAFADVRLRAAEPEALALGLGSREAGSRLHDALQKLWDELGTQAHLRSLSTPARRAVVETAVQSALRPLATFPGAERPWTRAFLAVVQERFIRLLMNWLHLELERGPFETIAQEQEETITVGPLQLKLRPDRIDKVDNGLVYIDYKTKYSLSTDDWLGSRPDAPQLPLYTLLTEPGQVRGLAFARLRPGKDLGWISLADTPGIFPDKKNSNHDLQNEASNWREELARLAQDFANGQTEVDPKSYPRTCEYCAFRLLCRLNPEELLTQATEDEETAEEEVGV